ncbi:MAG: Histidine kinase [Flavipsychrobacter sp.]|nr:Histidine kinase [Flavipsychrobacter sp.]
MPVATPELLDMSFLYDLADNDRKYIYEVVNLYLNNVSEGMANLETLAKQGDDFEAIQRQAHALKSSAGIVKVRGMYDGLVAIETAARDRKDSNVILSNLDIIMSNFRDALPLIEAERDKNRP